MAIFAETSHSGVKCSIVQGTFLGQISEAVFGQDTSPLWGEHASKPFPYQQVSKDGKTQITLLNLMI